MKESISIDSKDTTIQNKEGETKHIEESCDGSTIEHQDNVLQTTEQYTELFCKCILPMQEELYGLVLKNIKHEQEAEDVYQQIFEKCWKSLPNLRDMKYARPWAYRIASRTIADYYSALLNEPKYKGPREIPCSELGKLTESEQLNILINGKDIEDFFRDLLIENRLALLWEAFEELSEKDRAVIWLWYDRDWSLKRVAEELDMNYETVRKVFSRGIAKWKKMYLKMQERESIDE